MPAVAQHYVAFLVLPSTYPLLTPYLFLRFQHQSMYIEPNMPKCFMELQKLHKNLVQVAQLDF